MTGHLPEAEYAARRERLAERMHDAGVDALFVPPSSDLEYLTGLERDLPSFGQVSYANGWRSSSEGRSRSSSSRACSSPSTSGATSPSG